MVYQNLCETLGALFFLGKIRTVGKTIEVGDKLMTSTPDFVYPLASVPQAGRTQEDCRLLFIVEVKGTQSTMFHLNVWKNNLTLICSWAGGI